MPATDEEIMTKVEAVGYVVRAARALDKALQDQKVIRTLTKEVPAASVELHKSLARYDEIRAIWRAVESKKFQKGKRSCSKF